jgi:hypothetical protein
MAENDASQDASNEAQEPNIILAGGKKPITVPVKDTHEGEVNIGMHTIRLPDEETQRAGWYDKNAWMVIQQYPGVYKTPQPLGGQKALGQTENEGGNDNNGDS